MPDASPNALQVLHHLALLYLELAHGADDDLDPEETRAIAVKLLQWQPDRDPALIDHVIREATLSYLNDTNRMQLQDVVDILGQTLPPALCETVLHDLADIARADGKVIMDEKAFIRRIADAWNVDLAEEDLP